ncbi:ribonuclease H2, subunit B [Phakopsora pachyrhizi]|uniref:Ribonuclease H2, subunit B n=1 Tax=Phakopsora pachyrhizi TaxID=170000 RepID=A0AAV0BUU1_PHAPC|nr:ribonuclease H2, subunit B [Phakopsora pachyrhizi]CAH7689369.1 ribonuclease H2, subunit B [Phakopsora pachyrhizi]
MSASDPILIPSSFLEVEGSQLPILKLPHPKTRQQALFIAHPGRGIWEVQSVSDPSDANRTWFYQPGDDSISDQVMTRNGGRLLFVTPFDPFFMLLDLFFRNSFGCTKDQAEKNIKPRFEQLDVMLEEAQENWLFQGVGDQRPSSSDVDIFANAALRPETLERLFKPLKQDSETILWQKDPHKAIQEIKLKVEKLARAGRTAGIENRSLWSRLAIKEGLLAVDSSREDDQLVIEEIYRKVALDIVESYLPPEIKTFLQKNVYSFPLLEKIKKQEHNVDLSGNIGRRNSEEQSSKTKPKAVTKRAKKEFSSEKNQTITSFWNKASGSESSSKPKRSSPRSKKTKIT